MGISGGLREGECGVILHGYWRSSAAYRVRIALNLKQLSAEHVFHHLRRNEQREPNYLRLNPQGLLPALELDSGRGVLTQSLAICEWLEETHPEPRLLPRDPVTRAHIRAFALAIACDIHPLQNLKVLRRLREFGHDQDAVNSWAHDVVVEGLEACEALAPSAGAFLFAAMPTLAEVCLVPQLTNARRFGVDLSVYPRLLAAERACQELPAFTAAAPELQPDAEPG
jgi:maleylpyruvate isomerase